MKPSDLQLLELISFNEETGSIQFKNRRMLLFDADAIGLLKKEVTETVGHDVARRLFIRFGYARGYRDALSLDRWFDWSSERDWWLAGARMEELEGMVKVVPIKSSVDSEGKTFELEAEWINSYEAEQHLKHSGVSSSPVCWSLLGYVSGYTSAVLGIDAFFVERECVGRGDPKCIVVGGSEFSQNSPNLRIAQEQNLFLTDDIDSELVRIKGERTRLENLVSELEKSSIKIAQQEARVRELESQVIYLQETLQDSQGAEQIVGASPGIRRVLADVEQVAPTDATVLITGETGTGKEVIARAIHARSLRNKRPLVIVNCAALPAGLVESELFGHERGAFTGAVNRRLGKFEVANNATIFLDEIGELPVDTQAKFLRVLQQGEFERVGGTQTIKVGARVLAATNQQLEKLVAEGGFRSDLYYRLNVFPIQVPPLRDRPEDIRLLTNYFAQKFRAQFRKEISSIEQRSMERLLSYSWPGNVRELEHVVERAVLLSQGPILEINLPLSEAENVRTSLQDGNEPGALVTLDEMERRYIKRVLAHTGGVIAGKGGAAEILDLPPSTLRSRMKKLDIL
jgi:two-component system response regulator HydG